MAGAPLWVPLVVARSGGGGGAGCEVVDDGGGGGGVKSAGEARVRPCASRRGAAAALPVLVGGDVERAPWLAAAPAMGAAAAGETDAVAVDVAPILVPMEPGGTL